MQNVKDQVGSALHNVELDEREAHGECPEDYKGAFLFKLKSGVGAVRSNAGRVFRQEGAYDRYDFKVAKRRLFGTMTL